MRPRPYFAEHLAFLDKKVSKLLNPDLYFTTSESSLELARLLNSKAGPEQWRFTADLRPVLKFTETYARLMPKIEVVTA